MSHHMQRNILEVPQSKERKIDFRGWGAQKSDKKHPENAAKRSTVEIIVKMFF